jgi:preprotein translocase subunit SecE
MAEEKAITATPTPGRMDRTRDYFREVQVEFTRISWPTRRELTDSTMVVIVMVLLVSLFLFLVDRVLAMGVGLLFR